MRLIDADKIIFREIDEIGGEYEPYLGCSKSQIDSLPTVTPQELTTKNDLGVDREQLKNMIRGLTKWYVKRDNAEVGQPNTAVGLLYDDVMFGIDRLPSVTPQEPFINKPCVSSGVCEHDKNKVLNKIRAKIEPKCDRINSLASALRYPAHREIQELLCDILELLQAEK